MNNTKTSYGNIFKTTFLFGFVQVFKALISIIVNKLAAILIGPNGMGLLSIYNSTISLIQTGAGLGLNQSAVRDVAEANGTGDELRRNKVINITLRAVLYTGLLGFIITVAMSYFISDWTMGNHNYTLIYCILAVVICLNIINEGRQAIFKGMRLMRYLAYASIIGTTTSLFISIPLYYFFGIDGIIPSLLLSSMITLLASNYFIHKIGIPKSQISLKTLRKEASPMIKIGTVLMFVTFLQTIVAFCVNSFVRKEGGIEDVGFYNCGQYLLSGYFGLIITALMTDYYPRIAAVNSDNTKLSEELNKQTLVTLVLCCPIIAIFITMLPFFIRILYTEEFLPVIDYVKVAIFGTLIMSISNPCDMILVVKQESKLLVWISIVIRLFQLITSYILYIKFGLIGLGFSFILVIALHAFLIYSIAYKKYNIVLDKANRLFLITIIFLLTIAVLLNNIEDSTLRFISASTLIILFCTVDYYVIKQIIGINIKNLIQKLLHK